MEIWEIKQLLRSSQLVGQTQTLIKTSVLQKTIQLVGERALIQLVGEWALFIYFSPAQFKQILVNLYQPPCQSHSVRKDLAWWFSPYSIGM